MKNDGIGEIKIKKKKYILKWNLINFLNNEIFVEGKYFFRHYSRTIVLFFLFCRKTNVFKKGRLNVGVSEDYDKISFNARFWHNSKIPNFLYLQLLYLA